MLYFNKLNGKHKKYLKKISFCGSISLNSLSSGIHLKDIYKILCYFGAYMNFHANIGIYLFNTDLSMNFIKGKA